MPLTLVSTTESQANLNAAVSATDSWRTPPQQPEPRETKDGDAIPLDKLPPKKFNEVRDEQVRENKDAARKSLNGEEGNKPGQRSGWQKRIDKITARNHSLEERVQSAERRAAELEARLNGSAPKRETTEQTAPVQQAKVEPIAPQPTSIELPEVKYSKKFEEAAKRYPDFKQTLEAADRSGVQISESLESVIVAQGNSADVAYFLAKNPKLIPAWEADHTLAAQAARDLRAATTDRQSELIKAHAERMRKAFPDQSKLQKLRTDAEASGIGSSAAINSAVLEQPNSEQVALHLLQNHELRAELSRLSPAAAMARVGRIAEQLEARANGNREKPKPPEPIAPVGGSSTRNGLALDEMPIGDFIRVRNQQERARRR
jgi:hypothetical protein